jgi:hypothetical protein
MKPETFQYLMIEAASDTRRIQSGKPRQLISLEKKTGASNVYPA